MMRLSVPPSASLWVVLPALALAVEPNWRPVGPFGGTALSLAADPSDSKHLLAGARQSLVFETRDGGATWRRLPFPRHFLGDIRALWIDGADSRHLIVGVSLTGVGAGLYQSHDGGSTWASAPELAGLAVEHLSSGAGRIGAATRGGVFQSADGGATWSRATPAENAELQSATVVTFGAGTAMYAGTTHLPWRSEDGGATWQQMARGLLNDSDVFSLTVGVESPKRLFLSACSGMYTSADGGDSWTRFRGLPPTHRRTHVLRQDPRRAGTLYSGTTLGLYRSDDAGVTWRPALKFAVNALAFAGDAVFAATDGGGIQRSADGGKTWQAVNEGFVSRRVNSLSASRGTLVARTADGDFASRDGGLTWRRGVTPPVAAVRAQKNQLPATARGLENGTVDGVVYDPARPSHGFALQFGALYESTDSGATWTRTPAKPTGGALVDGLFMTSDIPNRLFAVTSDMGLLVFDPGTPTPR